MGTNVMNAIPGERMRRKAAKTVEGAIVKKKELDPFIRVGLLGKKILISDGRSAKNKLARMESAPPGQDRGSYENDVRSKWKPSEQ